MKKFYDGVSYDFVKRDTHIHKVSCYKLNNEREVFNILTLAAMYTFID